MVAGAVALLVSHADAQIPDHLECYRVKDALARSTYRADLAGLAPEPGCVIRTPARLLCVPTTKTLVTPPPPGGVAGTAAGRYLCYRVRCPKNVVVPIGVRDQFGTRDVRPRPTSTLLCAPLETTTSTTAASTTTTTTARPPPPTTTTARPSTSTTATVRTTTSTTGSPPPPTTSTTTSPPPPTSTSTATTTTTLATETTTTTLATETTTTTASG